MKNKIPDRWQNYTQMGTVVPGTRFLPFKTPLKEELCRRLDLSDNWFTPAMLREKVPKLKLVIDLTFTDRYYNAKEFFDHGIQHVKIKCPGGGQKLPSNHILKKFNEAIVNFFVSNPNLDEDNLIGVHCTHGLNRTGYFICRYMMEHCGFTPEQSIMAFEKARGYKIEREVYLKEIHKHYQGIKSLYRRKKVKNYGHKIVGSGVSSEVRGHISTPSTSEYQGHNSRNYKRDNYRNKHNKCQKRRANKQPVYVPPYRRQTQYQNPNQDDLQVYYNNGNGNYCRKNNWSGYSQQNYHH